MTITDLKDLYASIRLWFTDKATPSASGLISRMAKLEATIERTIDKETRDLANLSVNRALIEKSIKAKNGGIDLAYKLLNNVNRLTA